MTNQIRWIAILVIIKPKTCEMKRLFVLIAIVLLTRTAFAHPYGGLLGYFHNKPVYQYISDGDIRMQIEETYSFVCNGRTFVVSYDTCKACMSSTNYEGMRQERPLYLFRLTESGWVIASDNPLQVDWEETQNGITSYVSYFPWRTAGDKLDDEREFGGGAKNGSVKISPDGFVTIVIINHSMDDESHGKLKFSNKKIVLLPKGDGTFEVQ
jgi:hypothetical protein